MSSHLKVKGHLNQIRGYSASRPDREADWLDAVCDEIEALVDVTYSNFQARGEQLEAMQKELPESPQDTDSTETMIEALPDAPTSETLEAAVARVERTSEAERDQLRASEPVQPVAGLSGEASKVDWQTGMIKPEVFNGSLPETE